MEISWTEKAETSLTYICNFILESWDNKILQRFITKLNKSLDVLKLFPEIGKKIHETSEIRSFLILPYIKIFYRITKTQIIILALFDTRQDPEQFNL